MNCNLSAKPKTRPSIQLQRLLERVWGRNNSVSAEKQQAAVMVSSPLSGIVRQLDQIEDPVFSSEVLGKGCAIEPYQGEVVAPFDAVVAQLASTGHAIGLTGKNGVELLIHIGMETIELDGRYFKPQVQAGDSVRQGQCLLKFDMQAISAAGYSLMAPVVVTNSDDYQEIRLFSSGKITAGQDLLALYPVI